MSLTITDYEAKARAAVKIFWTTRLGAAKSQRASGRKDQGERSAVTGGKNMEGFVHLVADIVKANGLDDADIMLQRRLLTLPGFFRPTKLWDLLVVHEGKLVAVMEFKSHVGPSFGNNANNRCEEALGNALDLWTAFRESGFGEIIRPFVGYLMLLEDSPKSRSPVRDRSPHFPIFPEFDGASYADRYKLLCRKLVQERLYSAATVLLSPRSAADTGEYSEMCKNTGLKTFVTTLAGHIATEAALQTK